MHQYAYGATFANRFSVDYWTISKWEGDLLFRSRYHNVIEDEELRDRLWKCANTDDADTERMRLIREFLEKRGQTVRGINPDYGINVWTAPSTNVTHDSVCAYHPEIFQGMSRDFLLHRVFAFHDSIRESDLYRRIEDTQGTYDIAHLRRDDVANKFEVTGYPCISKKSYLKAFCKFGFDPERIQWTTDDWTGKWGVGSPLDFSGKQLGGQFPTGSIPDPERKIFFDWFPDFLRLYFARTIFRANSSFSFWAAFLSNQRELPATVFSPRIQRRLSYGDPANPEQELDCEFEAGNHPHWVLEDSSNCPDIQIN